MMLQTLQTYSKEIAALVAVLLGFGLNRAFRPRTKLIYSVRHAFTFLVDTPLVGTDGQQIAPRQAVHTASIFVSNGGIQSAKNLEVTFNWKPQFLNVWPARHFETRDSPHDRHSLLFDSLAPGEVVGIELLSVNANLPGLTVVRSDEAIGSEVAMIPQQVQPRWKVILAVTLMLLGLAASGYLLVGGVQLLAST